MISVIQRLRRCGELVNKTFNFPLINSLTSFDNRWRNGVCSFGRLKSDNPTMLTSVVPCCSGAPGNHLGIKVIILYRSMPGDSGSNY